MPTNSLLHLSSTHTTRARTRPEVCQRKFHTDAPASSTSNHVVQAPALGVTVLAWALHSTERGSTRQVLGVMLDRSSSIVCWLSALQISINASAQSHAGGSLTLGNWSLNAQVRTTVRPRRCKDSRGHDTVQHMGDG
jgi:hypothetical protein